MNRFLKFMSTLVQEVSQVRLGAKLAFAATAFVLWFLLGAGFVLGLSGFSNALGGGIDDRFQHDADTYAQLAAEEKDPAKAEEYRRASEARRSTDGVFGEAFGYIGDELPSWRQAGLMAGTAVSGSILVVTFASAVAGPRREDHPHPA